MNNRYIFLFGPIFEIHVMKHCHLLPEKIINLDGRQFNYLILMVIFIVPVTGFEIFFHPESVA